MSGTSTKRSDGIPRAYARGSFSKTALQTPGLFRYNATQMGAFLLAFLLVTIIPLAGGVLIALLLREIHIRHPLPLGGTIGPRKPPKVKARPAEIREMPIDPDEAKAFNSYVFGEDPPDKPQESASTVSSASDETAGFDDDSAGDVASLLNTMTSATPKPKPHDDESIIEASAQSKTEAQSGLKEITDDLDFDDIQALMDALPGDKMDPAQELSAVQPGVQADDAISLMAKELLGENFSSDAVEKQSDENQSDETPSNEEQSEQIRESLPPLELDIQEDESGTVQVSSPFFAHVIPQLAEITIPETILSTFSNDWIQESGSTGCTLDGDPSQFCFTEESRPLLVRKRKSAR